MTADTSLRAAAILDHLFGPAAPDSAARLPAMLDALASANSCTFWSVFLQVWPSCADTRPYERELLQALAQHCKTGHFEKFLPIATRQFWEALPATIKVFRGCPRARRYGLSWTTSDQTAATFARGHRGIAVLDAAIFEATVPKSGILAVFCDRHESEVLVDPWQLRNVRETQHTGRPL